MNKFIFSLVLTFLSIAGFGQQNSAYQNDLQFLYEALIKTPSYKDQITGNKKQEYDLLYQQLKTAKINPSGFDSLFKLSSLLWPIKDNHLGFYETANQEFKANMLTDTALVKKFRQSVNFKSYLVTKMSVDSLERELRRKPLNSVEGIYEQGGMKIGIYSTMGSGNFTGVMLSRDSPIWARGEMVLLLNRISADRFRGVYANLYTKDLYFIKNELFNNGRLYYFGSKRESSHILGYINSTKPLLALHSISTNTQYLRLGNFRTSNDALALSQQFYNKIKDSLTAENLIVDLRNNPGGGFKSSGKFLSLLRQYSHKGKIHVLINNRTVSNAEQFTVKLKTYDHVKTYGETTLGMITYGSNYGNTATLPSGKYKFYPTDMSDSGNYLPYEEMGIAPDFFLDQKSDWIEQVYALIRQAR